MRESRTDDLSPALPAWSLIWPGFARLPGMVAFDSARALSERAVWANGPSARQSASDDPLAYYIA
jgi:hypothetical protein